MTREMMRAAKISDCARYRYALSRIWDPEPKLKTMIFVMLNPSTADHLTDDPTIRRCLGFAEREKCGGLIVVNLYAGRATEPKELLKMDDPVGPENDTWLLKALKWPNAIVVGGWGTWDHKAARRADFVVANRPDILCLGRNGDGSPKHPLYLANDTPLMPLWPHLAPDPHWPKKQA